jgi:hypothetical protein
MNEHYPPILVDATADDILAVLRDMHRQQCTHDPEANPDISLSHDSTIAEWRDACDLLPWAKVAEAMNSYWSIAIPMPEWRDVLEPPKQRRLGGVCELLARHAKLPRVHPAVILGSRCSPGGAFLTIRSYLAEAGADMSGVAPSTPLHEYARRYPAVFLGPISQLAPGALPLVKIRTPVYHVFMFGMLIAWLALTIGLYTGLHAMALLAGLAMAICYAGVWTIGRWVMPKSVEFQGIHTFRDLAKVIACSTPTDK